MKIAIVTLTGERNYGNKLQNYALQYILENNGYCVETLRITKKDYFIPLLKACLQLPVIQFLPAKRRNRIRRRIAFYKFNNYIHQSYKKFDVSIGEKKLQKRFRKYDYILYGSDQIWNTEFSSFSDIYLGMYAPKEKNIAISASIGTDIISEKYCNLFKKGFNNFKAISVREFSAVNIVKDLSGLSVERLADPTMIVPKKQWYELEKSIELPENYLLTYFLGDKPEKFIFNLANEKNLIPISFDQSSKYGPREFLYALHHAKMICTDSFHAAVFSIIYEKDIYIYSRKDKYSSMNSRIKTLLDITAVKFSEEDNYVYIKSSNVKDELVKKNIGLEKEKFYSFIKKELT